jgi:hypothetical protein
VEGDQYSLALLREIVAPDPPAFWPPAPGFWVMLGSVVLVVLLVAWQWRVARNRNAYRKAGLSLLGEAEKAHDVSVVLKRVALAAFPRDQVASLYGDDWAAFLHGTCPRSSFSALIAAGADAPPNQELVDLASTWIRHHRVPEQPAISKAH